MAKQKKKHSADGVLRTGAILIADQAGFTRTMMSDGPQVALEAIWTIRRLVLPVIAAHGGEAYKVEADNVYGFFASVDTALAAALAIHEMLDEESTRRKHDLRVGIGIGYGELLYLPSEDDYYGLEVNLASKLGEDVACGGETLVSAQAVAAATAAAPGSRGRKRSVRMSGVRIGFAEWG